VVSEIVADAGLPNWVLLTWADTTSMGQTSAEYSDRTGNADEFPDTTRSFADTTKSLGKVRPMFIDFCNAGFLLDIYAPHRGCKITPSSD